MLMQDLQTVLLILSPLEGLHPFPVSFSLTTYHQRRACHFLEAGFALSHFREGDGGRGRTLFRLRFRTFFRSRPRFSSFFYLLKVPF